MVVGVNALFHGRLFSQEYQWRRKIGRQGRRFYTRNQPRLQVMPGVACVNLSGLRLWIRLIMKAYE
jgi:hypothetical protein